MDHDCRSVAIVEGEGVAIILRPGQRYLRDEKFGHCRPILADMDIGQIADVISARSSETVFRAERVIMASGGLEVRAARAGFVDVEAMRTSTEVPELRDNEHAVLGLFERHGSRVLPVGGFQAHFLLRCLHLLRGERRGGEGECTQSGGDAAA